MSKENENIEQDENYDLYGAIEMAYRNWLDNPSDNHYNSSFEYKNLVDLNNNPQVPTNKRVLDALAKYDVTGEQLNSYMQYMYTVDAIVHKAIDRLVNMLAFNWSMYCTNAKKSDYQTDEYKDDVRRVYRFFNNFNIKNEFRIVVKNMILNSEYFCWLRDSSGELSQYDNLDVTRASSYSLQMMPQEQCRITGKWTDKGATGYLWDFNLNYFNNPNVDITNYDPSIIRLYNENVKNGKLKSYTTNSADTNKTNSSFDGYARTQMAQGAFCFKFDTSNFSSVPPMAYLLKSALAHEDIATLQQVKDKISSLGIVLGEIKTKNNDKSSNDKSPFVIEPKGVVGLNRKASQIVDQNIKLVPLPTTENKLFQFSDNNPKMLIDAYKTTAGLASSASGMLYNDGDLGQFEVQSALNEDYRFISSVYEQFNSFLNYYVNKKTKKFKFRFRVDGSTMPFIQKQEQDQFMKLSDKGIQVNISKWASLYGLEPQELQAMMEEMCGSDIEDNLMLLLNTNTNNFGDEDNIVGRPETESESANQGRDYKK